MKLTNISLAVLVALGLVACGGSDDNNNQTTDPKPPKEIPGDGGNGGDGGTPPKTDDNNIDPNRKAADLTVPAAIADAVNADKKVTISNQFGDKALGYKTAGGAYEEDKSTKPGNVKFTTDYNFSKEGDVFASGSQVGAIYPSADPSKETQNAFVKGKSGKYYRVKSEDALLSYNDKSTYSLVTSIISDKTELEKAGKDIGYTSGKGIPQKKVVFLANAKVDYTTVPGDAATATVDPSLAPDPASNMDAGLSQVILTSVSVLGDSYNPNDINQTLDLNKIPKGEITTTPVTGEITIVNTKGDSLSNDRIFNRKIEVGNLKAYNLGYSIAYVGLDSSKENSKNIFNLSGQNVSTNDVNSSPGSSVVVSDGAYQVAGYRTPALPKDGRAIYTGKSFSEATEGDVQLVAEFFADRASVKGIVKNRKDILNDDKALPTLTLQPIQLTSPTQHITGGTGSVTGDSAHYTNWSVQFYGLEAEEAGGYLYHSTNPASAEVYTTKRDKLSNHSNDPSVE